MRHIVICGLSGSAVFFRIISYAARFSKKKKLLHKKYVFLFSLQLLSETFLIPRIIQRDITVNVHTSLFKIFFMLVRF
jgi:hypothetical protein